jgi:hypothetical protein
VLEELVICMPSDLSAATSQMIAIHVVHAATTMTLSTGVRRPVR